MVSAVYATGGGALDNANLVAEAERTRPLSVVMAEKLTALRHWASERTVSVD